MRKHINGVCGLSITGSTGISELLTICQKVRLHSISTVIIASGFTVCRIFVVVVSESLSYVQISPGLQNFVNLAMKRGSNVTQINYDMEI